MIADSGRFSEIASRSGVLDPDPELIQSGAFKSADEAGFRYSGS
jgi:hypothetical protein